MQLRSLFPAGENRPTGYAGLKLIVFPVCPPSQPTEIDETLFRLFLVRPVMTPRCFNTPEDLLSFLQSVNPQLYEQPSDFDRQAYLAQARHLSSELSHATGHSFSLDVSIQDASHSAEIPIPLALLCDTSIVQPALRLSNYAGLATITCERKIDSGWLNQIQSVIEQCGFTYVPEDIFGKPFDTRERMNGDVFNQLFDYI